MGGDERGQGRMIRDDKDAKGEGTGKLLGDEKK